MGLFSTLGKVLGKIDDISDIANNIPDKINQVKDLAEQAKGLYREHERKKAKETLELVDKMKDSLGRIDAKMDGLEYEKTIKNFDDKKIPLSYAISPQYDDMMHIGNNLFSVLANNKWGIIDINSQIIIPIEYDYIFAFDYDGSDDFIFPAQKDEKWGYINLKNETIIDFAYEDASVFKQNLAPVAVLTSDGEDFFYGYIDKSNELIIPARFDSARPFNKQDCATIGMYDESKGKIQYGVINKTGGVVINCRYENIRYEDKYLIGMKEFSDSDFYDYKGVPLTPTEDMKKRETEINDEKSMLNQAIICKNNNDVKNKIIPYFNSKLICGYFVRTDEGSFCKIEPIFEEAYNPNKFGYARVKYNGLYGVINLNE